MCYAFMCIYLYEQGSPHVETSICHNSLYSIALKPTRLYKLSYIIHIIINLLILEGGGGRGEVVDCDLMREKIFKL